MTTPLDASAADLAVVERLVRRSGTSFYRGMRVLPRDRRAAMFGIYAFCRLVDDIADEPGPENLKAHLLDGWRERVNSFSRGEAEQDGGDDGAVARVLVRAAERYQLRKPDFLAIIDGMQMDAETVIVAPSFETLDLYCDRVASAVGRLSVRAFGDASPAADEVAFHLGRALQLTNILRDLGEDAWRGRLYLPREWLAMDGVPTEAAAALASPSLTRVCQRAAREARQHFNLAHSAMNRCDRRAMKPARLMAATYAAILDRLEQRGWAKTEDRVSVPAWEKLLIAIRYGLG